MKSVLILSKWINASSVALAVGQVKARGLRTVLVSASRDDRVRDECDDHVLVDWDREDPATLIARLDQRGIVPIAVVNQVEPLMPWQGALAAHYGLPGVSAGHDVLASKTAVRERMRALNLSAMRFCDDPDRVDFFPAIVKPSRESAASWLVERVDSPAELLAYQRHLADLGLAGTELIIEAFLPGTEFSVDGPVVAGRFHPLMAVERPEHDDRRHHNAGLQIQPPQQDHVRAGVRALTEMIGVLAADLGLDQVWMHIEARVDVDGRPELVEINPRPAGGMYSAVIRELSGIDPMEAFVSMALGEFALPPEGVAPLREHPVIGFFDVEADRLGVVEIRTTAEDLRALPGVIDAEVADGFRITSLDKENFFIRFALAADSVSRLRARVASVLSTLDYRITAQREPARVSELITRVGEVPTGYASASERGADTRTPAAP